MGKFVVTKVFQGLYSLSLPTLQVGLGCWDIVSLVPENSSRNGKCMTPNKEQKA